MKLRNAKITIITSMIILTAFVIPKISEAGRAIPDKLLEIPVFVKYEKGSASGFYLFSDKFTYFLTAYHVFNSMGKNAELESYAADGRNVLILNLELLNNNGNIKIDNRQDFAIIRLGEWGPPMAYYDGVILKEQTKIGITGMEIKGVKKFEDVLIANETYIFGYPASLGLKEKPLPQFDYAKPLLRKGIVAGKNEKLKTVILDCPSYPGNSGGPAVEIERIEEMKTIKFRLIGLVSEFIPYEEKWINVSLNYVNTTISNSGYSIIVSMDSLLDGIAEWEGQKSRTESAK